MSKWTLASQTYKRQFNEVEVDVDFVDDVANVRMPDIDNVPIDELREFALSLVQLVDQVKGIKR